MNQFGNIIDSFTNDIRKFARVWHNEQDGWQDSQAREFEQKIIIALASSCTKTLDALERMSDSLDKLEAHGLIRSK